jgi:hypothetical protein
MISGTPGAGLWNWLFGSSSPTPTTVSPYISSSFGQMINQNVPYYNAPSIDAPQAEKDSFLKSILYTDGKFDPVKAGGIVGGIGGLTGMFDPKSAPQGYQGGIPSYKAVRAPVVRASDPNRRPGSMGRRYFSDVLYQNPDEVDTAPAIQQAAGLASLDPMVRRQAARPDLYGAPLQPASGGFFNEDQPEGFYSDPRGPIATVLTDANINPNATPDLGFPLDPDRNSLPNPNPVETTTMAAGGIAQLKEGKYLAGASDGMADRVPATIDNVEPAALSDGEYVIPADVVSHLGNGNSDAGAKVLDEFLVRVREKRTGNGKQGKEIDPEKLLPKIA